MAPANHSPLADRPTYSRDQLAKYVSSCIAPSPSYTISTLEEEVAADPLGALARLQLRQLAFNPWGNIALHYSWHRVITLDPDQLYTKIVERKLGGYCMENNAFFSTVLRSLGYQLYVTGARISNALGGGDPEGFGGWQHEVILVTINSQKYLVDVGFGPGNPTHPLPLIDDPSLVYPSVPGAEVRVNYRPLACNTDASQRLWVLETHNTTHPAWQAGYCFTEIEWLPDDFKIINHRTSKDPQSWFTYRLVLSRFLVDEETRTQARGTVTLVGNAIERRVGEGAKEVVVDAKTEKERIAGLRTWFNVVLLPEEERAIAGMASEISPPPNVH